MKTHLYYDLKPYLPWRLRMALRRILARRELQAGKDVWPINEAAGQPPDGWSGWPDGKQFAFVLTHDIEGSDGLAKCRQLMQLEMDLGFRSSFNFIPEGGYMVPRELRDELTRNGFEVGVHDLHHDGKLYRSHQDFSKSAVRINQYLKEWGASGFRGGFMFHNLDWAHELNIDYDTSTFDTDPFEPQPDSVNTIFPFWVTRPNPKPRTSEPESSQGYVELPYTLPQDSTLFLLLQESSQTIWERKVDWIAQHGGMALVGVHPDYIDFRGSTGDGGQYSYVFYEEFLNYVSQKFQGQYWHATPREVARWYRAISRPSSHNPGRAIDGHHALKGKRAAVVLYSYYPSDPRPRREAEALANAGMKVDVICLRQNAEEATRETIHGVNIRRVPLRRRRDSKLTYLLQYGAFIAFSATILAYRVLRKRYHLVHVHNMPDILVFSGLVPKLRGARVILDLHDPMPELMMTIFGLGDTSFSVPLLRVIEKQSIRFADHVLTVNLACKRIFASRSCHPEKIQVLMNTPDEEIFGFQHCRDSSERDPAKPFVIVYHGSIVERHGLDLAVQALGIVKKTVPSAELRVHGPRTPFLDSVIHSVRNNGLHDAVHYLGAKSLEEIVKAIEESDVGIIPNRRSVFTEINTPTRIFEYLSRGKPVIAPLTPGITDYFGQDELIFFQLGDVNDLARKIEYVYFHPHETTEIMKRGQKVYLSHRWSQEKCGFLDRVSEMVATGR